MSTPIKFLHFRGHWHKGPDSKPEILIFGGKSWGMGWFIFLYLPCDSRRGWPGSGGTEVGSLGFLLVQKRAKSQLQSLMASSTSQALALANAVWSSSQAIKLSVLGNSTAVREEEERGGTASSDSLQTRSGTIPVTLLIPGAM